MKIENPNEVSNATAEPKKKSKFIIIILLIVVIGVATYFGRGLITNEKYLDINLSENLDNLEQLIDNKDRKRFVFDQIDKQVEIIEKSIELNLQKRLLGKGGVYSELSLDEVHELDRIKGQILLGLQNEDDMSRLGEIVNSLIEKIGLDDFKVESDFTLASLHLMMIYEKEFQVSGYVSKKKGELVASEPFYKLSELFEKTEWVDLQRVTDYQNALLAIDQGEATASIMGFEQNMSLRFFREGLRLAERLELNTESYKEIISDYIEDAELKSN